MTIEIPLFPLRSVLCPGVALPLHIFEERYRLMIARCIERDEPFGVVLVREGDDAGHLTGRMAEVGTTAAIRRAGRYPDGRFDILTVGEQRFRLESLDTESEPFMLARVNFLDEPTGPADEVRARADRVGRRFLRYLDLLQPDDAEDGLESEIEVDDETVSGDASDDGPDTVVGDVGSDAAAEAMLEMDAEDLTPEQRRELLMAAARRLTATGDPTALSYVLTALIQVDLSDRQELLEAADTVERLDRLDGILTRESWFLQQGLRPIIIETDETTRGRT